MENENPDYLRSPLAVCHPDPRSESFAILGENGFRSMTLEDYHQAVSVFSLHGGVPENIRVQFETSKNLYLYGWFVYRFYPVAQHHAHTCLELALRERFEPELLKAGEKRREFGPGIRRLLRYAIEKGYLKNEHFQVWHESAKIRARDRYINEQFQEMRRLGLDEMEVDDSCIEITEADKDPEYVSTFLESIPWIRNHYAHGSKTLHNQVLGTFRTVSEIINQIFPIPNAD